MNVIIEARDKLVSDLKRLEPGSEELARQVEAIKSMSEIDIGDRNLEFEVAKEETRKAEKLSELEFEKEKEETRKLEKSNETQYSSAEIELRKIDLAIELIDVVLNPGNLIKTILNNSTRVKRDIMGYQFEETGVIGSHTFNNAQKDKYD